MALSAGEVEAVLKLRDELTGELRRVKGETNTFASSIKSIGPVIAQAFAAKQIFDFGVSAVKSYSEQEDALMRLGAALRAQGTYAPELMRQYEGLGKTFQNTTIYADETVESMMALLTQVGNVMPDQMEKSLQAATNLASGLGIDLRTATMLVGKAFAGETGTLARYGVIIGDNIPKTERAAEVLKALNAQFGGQASAAAQTYSGQIALLSNQWGEFKESVGEVLVDVLRPMLPILKDAAVWMQGVGKAVEWARTVFDALLAAGLSTLKWLVDFRVKLLEMTNAFGVNNKAISEWKQASNELAAQIHGVVNKVDALKVATESSTGAVRKSVIVDQEAIDAAKKHAEELARLKETLGALERGVVGMGDGWEKLGTKIEQSVFTELVKVLDELWKIENWAGQSLLADEWESIGMNIKISEEAMKDAFTWVGPKITEADAATEDWGDQLSGLAQSFAQLAQISGGALGDVLRVVGTTIAAFDTLSKSIEQAGKQGLAGFSGTVSTIGTMIGLVKTLGEAIWDDTAQIARMHKAFADVSALLEAGNYMTPFERLTNQSNDFSVAMTKAYALIGRSAAEAEADFLSLFTKHGLSIAAINSIKDKLTEIAVWQEKVSKAYSEIAAAGATTFGVLTPAIRDHISDLLTMNGLTDEQRSKLSAMLGENAIDFAGLQKMAEDYGITLQQLGPKFQQADLNKTAGQIKNDFDLLLTSGADVNGLLEGMADEVSNVVNNSKKFGIDVPEYMRPMIEATMRAGLLFDENGDKITDMTGIKFADTPLTTSLDTLGKTIQGLIDVLTGKNGITASIEAVNAKELEDKEATYTVHVRQTGEVGSGPSPSSPLPSPSPPPYQRGTPGLGFVDFGAGTRVTLHGREAVIPESRRVDFGGGAGDIKINLNVSGVWDPSTVRQMSDMVGRELMRRTGRKFGSA